MGDEVKFELEIKQAEIEKAVEAFNADIEMIAQSRPNITEFEEWLKKTDYFEAPASGRYHLSCPFGLFVHSYHVVTAIKKMNEALGTGCREDSLALVGWFHDLCKVNRMTVAPKWKKDKSDKWMQVGGYAFEDKFPLGHATKSLYMLMKKGIQLTKDEALAITHHMGPVAVGDSFELKAAMENSWEKSPLSLLSHEADLFATYQLDISEDCVIKHKF